MIIVNGVEVFEDRYLQQHTTLDGVPIGFGQSYFVSPRFFENYYETHGVQIHTWRDLRDFFVKYRSRMASSTYYLDYGDELSRYFSGVPNILSFPSKREVESLIPRFGDLDDPIHTELKGTDFKNYVLINTEQSEFPQRVPFKSFSSTGKTVVYFRELSPSHSWDTIRNYTWRPETFDFRTMPKEQTHTFFGMELEVSTNLSPSELQKIVTTVEPRQERFFYMKDDVSITRSKRHSYEIVTIPMSPKKQKHEWKTLFRKLEFLCKEKGIELFEVFDLNENTSNGLHIHVSKESFIETPQQFHLRKFFTAWNQSQPSYLRWLQAVARRPSPLSGHSYCRPHPALEGKTLPRRMRETGTCRREFHHSLCHETRDTLEVRVFQGIPDINHILTCIEMVEAFIEFSREMPYSAIRMGFENCFTQWVLKRPVGYRNLKETLQCA